MLLPDIRSENEILWTFYLPKLEKKAKKIYCTLQSIRFPSCIRGVHMFGDMQISSDGCMHEWKIFDKHFNSWRKAQVDSEGSGWNRKRTSDIGNAHARSMNYLCNSHFNSTILIIILFRLSASNQKASGGILETTKQVKIRFIPIHFHFSTSFFFLRFVSCRRNGRVLHPSRARNGQWFSLQDFPFYSSDSSPLFNSESFSVDLAKLAARLALDFNSQFIVACKPRGRISQLWISWRGKRSKWKCQNNLEMKHLIRQVFECLSCVIAGKVAQHP